MEFSFDVDNLSDWLAACYFDLSRIGERKKKSTKIRSFCLVLLNKNRKFNSFPKRSLCIPFLWRAHSTHNRIACHEAKTKSVPLLAQKHSHKIYCNFPLLNWYHVVAQFFLFQKVFWVSKILVLLLLEYSYQQYIDKNELKYSFTIRSTLNHPE